MRVRLARADDGKPGRIIEISKSKSLIGRSDECQLRLKSTGISRRHCLLVIADERVTICDLGSRHGTFVNGGRIEARQEVEISAGDRLGFANFEFEVLIDHSDETSIQAKDRTQSRAGAETTKMAAVDQPDKTEFEISSWLEEADEVDREMRRENPDVRHALITETPTDAGPHSDASEEEEENAEAAEPIAASEKTKKSKKKEWGKLPKVEKPQAESSEDAAKKALGALGEATKNNKKD